jgi:3-hydroxyisobutyrate dehydrogenase|tara:strand:+ start:617 stop:1495 length:879 start_codon:yes stop_codon:yes gene_type:complete
MEKIGFIGLGNMGMPMAQNLISNGIKVKGFDVSEEVLKQASKNKIEVCSDTLQASKEIDVLITMLPNGEAVSSVFNSESLLENIDPSILIIECSTISPKTSKELSLKASSLDLEMIDAPVSGGVKGAEEAGLTFMVGGSVENVEKAKPILSMMGKNIFHAGDSGSGQIAKLCNNMLLAIHMSGTAEAISMGVKSGLDPSVLSEIMSKSSGGNWSLDKYNPYPGVMIESPASKDYQGGFLNKLMIKDLNLAKELAQDSKTETPMGDSARKLYDELIEQGLEDLDFSSVQKLFQ